MTRKELVAYCAGIFDGEGSVTVAQGCVRVRVTMTDVEPLDALERTFGGSRYGPRKGTNAPLYVWEVRGWRAVEAIYRAFAPFLCPRRRVQFAKAFASPRAPERAAPVRPPPCGFDRNRASGGGYTAHWKRGEPACDDCYNAAKLYRAARKEKR